MTCIYKRFHLSMAGNKYVSITLILNRHYVLYVISVLHLSGLFRAVILFLIRIDIQARCLIIN